MVAIFVLAQLCWHIPTDANKNGISWWRHQMETLSALLALCAGNSPDTGEFHAQRPVTRSFDVYFDLRQNTCLRKHSRRVWFEMPSRSFWRHCNDAFRDLCIEMLIFHLKGVKNYSMKCE